jgi:ubiquinone/menaquinone biosynthesis C-methylase UbiE
MTRALAATLAIALLTAGGAAQSHPAERAKSRLFPPERLGELEGPDRDAWQRPDQIMDALQIGESSVVADLGAGGGWFTVRLAQRVRPNGHVYAEDIQPQMVQAIDRRVQRDGFQKEVTTVLGTADDPKLRPGALDAVLIVDAYHEIERPVTLLQNVKTALKPTGVVAVINFKNDGGGPGPDMEQRVDPERVIADAAAAGLELRKRDTFLRYQYMLTFGPAPK